MRKSDISEMVKNERLKLKAWDCYQYYFPVFYFLIVPLLNCYYIIRSHLTNDHILFERITSSIEIVIIFLSLAIICFVYKYWKLRFEVLHEQVSLEHFRNAVDLTRKELEWQIIEQNDHHLIAHSWNSNFSSGEQITIIRGDNKLLVNSISNISRSGILGGNKKNIRSFGRHINRVLEFNN